MTNSLRSGVRGDPASAVQPEIKSSVKNRPTDITQHGIEDYHGQARGEKSLLFENKVDESILKSKS